MARGLYSAAHDRNNKPQKPAKQAKQRQVKAGCGHNHEPVKFAPNLLQPTEYQRRQLRASQLRQAKLDEIDPDLMDVEMLGRPSENIEFGRTVGPQIMGPQPDRMPHHMRDLDMLEVEQDPDLFADRRAALQPARDIEDEPDATEEPQGPLDTNEMRSVDQGVGHLFGAAQNLVTALKAAQTKFGSDDPAIQHHIQSMLDIADTAIGDWIKEMDDHLGSLVEALQQKSTGPQQ